MKRCIHFVILMLLTVFAFVLQGYHPGAEDDGVYLTAIKKELHPALYPYNAQFFTLQLQATIFDEAVAATTKWTHLPIAYVALSWQITAIALLLAGCSRIVRFCFNSQAAQLAGLLTICCLLTLSVAGTALYISDEHLHPRLVATDAILFAISDAQRGKWLRASILLLVALLFHPIMAVFGISFCVLYGIVQQRTYAESRLTRTGDFISYAAAAPGGWLFAPATPQWRVAVAQHSYYDLTRWAWYEWLGALAPPLLLWLLARFAQGRANIALYRIAATLTLFSILQLAAAMLMLLPPGLDRLEPLQPMRYLHLTFLLMFLLAGAALGQHVLRTSLWRWVLIFLPLAAVNGYAQRTRYPATPNLELPWRQTSNPWLQAFAWVQSNAPVSAVFALDPDYLSIPGEDHHSFRALAERSSLVDDEKDAAVVTQVPKLADAWLAQHKQEVGWQAWHHADFVRLAQTTPVRWVIVAPAQASGLTCPYSNGTVSVCRIPLE